MLAVDRTSKITMTGRGLPGGSSQTLSGSGGAVPGAGASTLAHGGSHGGAGGSSNINDGHTGSTYDNPQHPSKPGGGGGAEPGSAEGNPGGGVLDINGGTLLLAGLISADGLSGDGPTPLEPEPHDFDGGGGAGASVYVKVASISGHGSVTALGGDTCAASHPPLLLGVLGCSGPNGGAGAGGGGRVALISTTACTWHGSLSAAGGVDVQADVHADRAKRARGADSPGASTSSDARRARGDQPVGC